MKIKDYGVIGDTNTIALVGKNGSIDWCCLPRFDSPSIFAYILDREKGGCFQIEPTTSYDSFQEYVPNTNILKTIFKTQTGIVELIDFMPCGIDKREQNIIAYSELHRIIVCKSGIMELKFHFDPRFNYAKTTPVFDVSRHYIQAYRGNKVVTLIGNINLKETVFTLKKQNRKTLVLYFGQVLVRSLESLETSKKLQLTQNYWRTWLNKSVYQGPYQKVVDRSILALKLLSHSNSGAFVAAPTTSLPESLGGSRNWDYRYTWIRDSVFTLQALTSLGYRHEAWRFMGWIKKISLRDGIGLQIMYGIDGERNLPETNLTHLSGYGNSKPVRIGNGAHKQSQHDIFGELLDISYLFQEKNGPIDDDLKGVLINLIEYVCRFWEEPDSGIWEMRVVNKQFTYSHLMCWVAIDRGLKLAKNLYWEVPVSKWRAVAAEIRSTILNECYNSKLGAFTQGRNDDQIDASALLIPIYRFLPFTDYRVLRTIEAVQSVLLNKGLVYRYLSDEFEGEEGGFLFCTFWLIECLNRIGKKVEARAILDQVLSYSNDLLLFSEEIDPETGKYLGNYPQAFSHIGLINAILSMKEE